MTPGDPGLDRLLAALRRRWRARVVLRGGLLAVAAAAVAVLVLLLFGAAGAVPGGWRPVLRWLPVAVFGLSCAAAALGALFRAPSRRALALRAEEGDPGLEHLPSVLLELPEKAPYFAALSERARARLAAARPAGLLPVAPRRALVAASLGAFALAWASLLPGGGPAAAWAAWGRAEAGAADAEDPAVAAAKDLGGPAGADLDGLRVRIVPPGYTGGVPREEDVGDGIEALAGSHVRVEGRGGRPDAELVRLDGEGRALAVVQGDPPGWRVEWVLAPEDRGLSLAVGDGEPSGVRRVVPIRAVPDGPPEVELLSPDRDLTLATGSGSVTVRARARDPHGLDGFLLTWVHTRGSGESFDFREGTGSWDEVRTLADGVEGVLELSLEGIGLGAGDVLHLRAMATDRNDVTGPGTGVSSTRQLRVIREGEEMEVDALAGFPLDVDLEPVLSQRMILLLTHDLMDRAPALAAARFREEAHELAEEQARLRMQLGEDIYSRATGAMEPVVRYLGIAGPGEDVHDQGPPGAGASRYGVASVFDPMAETASRAAEHGHDHGDARGVVVDLGGGTGIGSFEVGGPGAMPTGFGVLEDEGHDHDGDPILSVNRPLLAIYNAMWASEQNLLVARPDASVPHQEEALEGLQALRENTRVFPRGRVTVPPVDVAGARGTGEVDDAEPRERSPGEPAASAAAQAGAVEALLRGLDGLGSAGAARDAATLAVDLLADPLVPDEAAGRVARAADRLRGGDLQAARELLVGALELLAPAPARGGAEPDAGPVTAAGAAFLRARGGEGDPGGEPGGRVAAGSARPFTFVTLRYESGNWDSAPLVPQNLIHSLAQYTELDVEPQGIVLDLAAPEIFRYPVLYLTGHLPVRFTDVEARNLKAYVERGGFVFMDDHNHDVDGAFHRSATAEIARIFGDDALEALPNDHELYGTFFHFEDGPPTTSHELSGWGDGLIHRELHAVVVDGRIGILYSNKDYSSEWSYHAVNKRFLAVDNTRFGVNLLLYALTR